MSDKKKLEQVNTPTGIAQFPWLHKPDTKFNPDGDYRVRLALPAKAKETKELIAKIDEAHEAAIEKARAEVVEKKGAAAAKKIKIADKPYKDEEDKDTGKPTGNVILSFKMKAKITSKKSGETFEQRPRIFDSHGEPVAECPRIGGGSKIRVSAFLVPFYTAQVGAGVSLRLRAVKIKELVEFGGGDAGSYGFADDDEDGGYEAPKSKPASKKPAKTEDDGEEDDDVDF